MTLISSVHVNGDKRIFRVLYQCVFLSGCGLTSSYFRMDSEGREPSTDIPVCLTQLGSALETSCGMTLCSTELLQLRGCRADALGLPEEV